MLAFSVWVHVICNVQILFYNLNYAVALSVQTSVLLVGAVIMKVVLRCTLEDSGEQSAMMHGT